MRKVSNMPNPADYKDQASFMSECMRVTKSEGLTHDQCLGKCIGMWKGKSKTAGKLQKDIDKAKSQNNLPSVFLGGSCDDNNAWRKNVKEEFKGKFFFVDPYDPEWEAEGNIYEELAAILNVDHIIFYKGGKGTEREKKFMENTDKDYKSFEGLDELKSHLKAIIPPALKKACISEFIRKIASRLIEASHSYSMVGIEVPTPIANRIKKWTKDTIPEDEIREKEEDKHITVCYGLDSKDLDSVKEFLSRVKPFSVTLNKTSMFWNDRKSDVLKIGVNSPALQSLYSELKEKFNPAKQYPEYNPHVTIAYLKKGYVEKYLDEDYSDVSFDVNTLTFYDNDSKKTHIKLNGR